MIDSVIKYKGFYIARYELTGTVENPTSKRGKVLSSKNWYVIKNACNNIINNQYAKSIMIYGCQWDEVMEWIIRSGGKTNAEVNSNSTSWGYYSSSGKIETGSNQTCIVNNIYDLAGNCSEWTQEAIDIGKRIYKGRLYNYSSGAAANAPASIRYNNYPYEYGSYYTSRPVLIINL